MYNDFASAKVLVVGLDSATFDVIQPMLEAGQLPNLRNLMSQGASSKSISTIPPMSAAAWVTAITGANPGQHGVFDFQHLDLNSFYGRSGTPVHSTHFQGTTIFDYLSERGLRVGAFNVPMTFPAWPINGVMVSGPVTPDLTKPFTYPENLAATLGPMASAASPQAYKDLDADAYFEALCWDIETHFHYGRQLLREHGPFDLFWFHLHALDSGQHRFWPNEPGTFFFDAAVPQLEARIAELYRRADAGLGSLLTLTGPETTVFVLSDHGARGLTGKQVNINVWLRKAGLLRPANASTLERARARILRPLRGSTHDAKSYQGINWSETYAFAIPLTDPIGGIVLNIRGRQPQGIVEANQVQKLTEKIVHDLGRIQDSATGRSIVQKSWRREEVYRGRSIDGAPDILFQVDPDYLLGYGVHGTVIGEGKKQAHGGWNGIHAMEGIFAAAGPNIRHTPLSSVPLQDIAPSILCALEQPLPNNMDGQVIPELFEEKWLTTQRTLPVGPTLLPNGSFQRKALTMGEADAMMEHLRALGYVE